MGEAKLVLVALPVFLPMVMTEMIKRESLGGLWYWKREKETESAGARERENERASAPASQAVWRVEAELVVLPPLSPFSDARMIETRERGVSIPVTLNSELLGNNDEFGHDLGRI